MAERTGLTSAMSSLVVGPLDFVPLHWIHFRSLIVEKLCFEVNYLSLLSMLNKEFHWRAPGILCVPFWTRLQRCPIRLMSATTSNQSPLHIISIITQSCRVAIGHFQTSTLGSTRPSSRNALRPRNLSQDTKTFLGQKREDLLWRQCSPKDALPERTAWKLQKD
jgi:hypothetical protein